MINIEMKNRQLKLMEYVFYISYCFIIFSYFYGSTTLTYLIPFPIAKLIRMMGVGGLILSLISKKNYSIKSIMLSSIFFLISMLIEYWTSDITLLVISLLIFSAIEMSIKKIFKLHFIVISISLLIVMILSQTGFILDIVYYRNNLVRHSFGIAYATDFAAYVFYLFLEYSILKRNNYKLYNVIIGVLLGLFINKYCDARLDMILIFLTGITFYIIKKVDNNKFASFFCKTSILAFPIGFFISFFTSYYYNPNNPFLFKLNQLLSNRLVLGKQAFDNYPIKWFGQYIYMRGNGGLRGLNRNKWIESYFYIDSSFLRLLLLNGIMGLLMVFIIYSLISLLAIKNKDKYIALALILVCIHEIVTQFITNVGYNVLPIIIFSLYDFNVLDTKKIKRKHNIL